MMSDDNRRRPVPTPPPYQPTWKPTSQPPYPPMWQPAPPPTVGAMFGKRLLGLVLDNLLVGLTGWLPAGGLAALVAVAAPKVVTPGPCPPEGFAVAVPGGCETPVAWATGLAGVAMLLILVASFYFVIARPMGRTGQSFGPRIAGIKVVDATTFQPIGVGRAIARELASVLSMFLYLGFLWMFVDPGQQTLHDKLVRSVVLPV